MRLLFIGYLISVSSGCSSTTQLPEIQPPTVTVPQTALGPGDVFEIRIYDEEDLSGEFRVASDGTINFPLIGNVIVENLTASQIRYAISDKLKSYIKSPSVSVFVKEYTSKKIYVFGQIQKAGTFPYEEGMNIIQAITLAGGFSKLANKDVAYVTRIVDGSEQRLKISVQDISEGRAPNFKLRPGDIVYIAESLF